MVRIATLLIGLFVSANCFADIKEVELNENNDEETSNKGHRSVAPTVNYGHSCKYPWLIFVV